MVPALLAAALMLVDAAPAAVPVAAPSAAPPAAAPSSTVSPVTVQGEKNLGPGPRVCHNETSLGTRVPHPVCHYDGGNMASANARMDLRQDLKVLNREFDYKPDNYVGGAYPHR